MNQALGIAGVVADQQASLRALASDLSVYMYTKGVDGRYTFASRGVCALFGLASDAIVGHDDAEFFDLEKSPDLPRHDREVLEHGHSVQAPEEVWVRRTDEQRVYFSVKVPLLGEGGRILGLCGVSIDMTRQVQDTTKLVNQNQLLDTVLANVDAFVYQKDAQGRYLFVNKRVADLYARPITDILGRTDRELLPLHIAENLMAMDREVLSCNERMAHQEVVNDAEGMPHYFWSIKVPLRLPGQSASIIGFSSEITELLALQDSLQRQKTTDELTGLRNRALFEANLTEAVDLATKLETGLAVVMIDIDHFKYINTTYGQGVGDRLLVQIATRLAYSEWMQGSLARFSGNRFAAVVQRMHQPQDVVHVTAHLREVLSAPFEVDGQRFHVTASVGASLYPLDGDSAPALITFAEAAMYRAKEKGRDQLCFYSHDIGEAIAERAKLEHGLREALERGEFELYYQPKVELSNGRVCGVEALIRWRREGYGLISPAVFIPLAEQLGLINEIGAWIIAQACGQLRDWAANGLEAVSIAVNLSPYQLRDASLPRLVAAMLAEYGIAPGRLEMEVTESLMMNNPDHAIAMLEAIRDLGVGLAIDDFGTGFSSMSYLKRLPVNTLKLDKSFIDQIAQEECEADLCAGLVALAHKLGLQVVAEGVETEAQLELLRTMQCEVIQGYYFSRPLPVAAVEAYIRQSNFA